MTTQENLAALADTLNLLEKGMVCPQGMSVKDYLEKSKECTVFLPEDIKKLQEAEAPSLKKASGHCKILCEDADTFTMANRIYEETRSISKDTKILALNFANPYHPGGGVRRGANAQEEDLCRRSGLLLSLESDKANSYYQYNLLNAARDFYGNDYGTNSMILTPFVNVLKDKCYKLQEEHPVVGVLTVAAPIIRDNQYLAEDYVKLLQNRISSMLLCAASFDYTHLILGAWGCGAFGNKPETVAGAFKNVIDNFSYGDKSAHQLFEQIVFAVPYDLRKPVNYKVFCEMFGAKHLS